MLSPRGRCFAFDERADGYVRGEGGGVVILKPLAEALAAGDTIRAVILATGTNSDGRTIGLSLPSEAAQAALLASVYAEAQIDPEALAFFEMHGTGTPVGDPVEAAAVGRTIGRRRRETLPIGSVKTNIGHLEPASGMAGLLKAALALERGLIPPTLNCDSPSPNIAFEALNLRLLREAEPLPGGRRQHYAGVNSFGFGGTNAHVVLAAPPSWQQRRQDTPEERRQRDEPAPPLLISAAGEAALRELVAGWRSALGAISDEQLDGAVRAAARGRDHHRHRLAALGRSAGNAGLLAGYLDGEAAAEIVSGTAVAEGKLAFVFSGNGAQFPGMGRAALEASAAFRAAVEMVDDTLRPRLGWSVAELIAGGVAAERVARTDIAQPMLFAIQVGIVEALRAAGVTAGGFLGHSVGEIAAAWAAGALSLAEAGHVVVARSRSQQRTQGAGRMAALALDGDAARSFLAELDSSAEIAAFNAARSVTLSGSGAEIDRLALEAHRRNLWFRRLDLDFAFHSRSMDPIREELLASLAGLASRPPAARLVSSVTGTVVETGGLDADHWWRNIRNPVRFAAATAALIGEGYRIFVEIGPNAILHSYLSDGLRGAEAEGRVIATLSRSDGDGDPFPTIAARCYVAGYDLAAAPGFDGPADPRGLPLYPWQRQRYWFDKTVEANDPESPPFDHPLLGFRQHGPAAHWLNHLDAQVLPWIADHAVEGIAVFPAAAILETAFAAARWRWPEAAALEAFDVEMRRPLPFEAAEMRELRTTILSDDGDWEVASRARLSSEPLTVHAVGRIAAASDARPVLRWTDCRSADCPPGQSAQGGARIDAEALYRLARRAGLDYGRRFRTVDHIAIDGADGAVVALDPSPIGEPLDDYLLHPALLDGALQGLLGLLAGHGREEAGSGFLPWRFGRARLPAPFGRVASRARLRLTRIGVRSASADIALYDAAGAIVAEIEDCWLRRVDLGRRAAADGQMFHVDLVPAPRAEFAAPAVLEEAGAALAELAASRKAEPQRHDQALLLDALIGVAALPPLTGWATPGGSFTIDELVDRAVVAPASRGLLECLLATLERLGAARDSHGEWRLDPANDLPDAGEIWRRLLADAPDLVAELALAATALETLPQPSRHGSGARRGSGARGAVAVADGRAAASGVPREQRRPRFAGRCTASDRRRVAAGPAIAHPRGRRGRRRHPTAVAATGFGRGGALLSGDQRRCRAGRAARPGDAIRCRRGDAQLVAQRWRRCPRPGPVRRGAGGACLRPLAARRRGARRAARSPGAGRAVGRGRSRAQCVLGRDLWPVRRMVAERVAGGRSIAAAFGRRVAGRARGRRLPPCRRRRRGRGAVAVRGVLGQRTGARQSRRSGADAAGCRHHRRQRHSVAGGAARPLGRSGPSGKNRARSRFSAGRRARRGKRP